MIISKQFYHSKYDSNSPINLYWVVTFRKVYFKAAAGKALKILFMDSSGKEILIWSYPESKIIIGERDYEELMNL